MLESIKTIIETYNTTDLYAPILLGVNTFIPFVFPIVGSIAIVFFAIKVFRKILNV